MSNIPSDLRYTKSHEWVRVGDDGIATVGITEYAVENLGEVVFIELPEKEQHVSAFDEIAVVESVKAASDIYSPLSGEIVAVNETLNTAPEVINEDAYAEGWFFRIKIENDLELDDLLDASSYAESLED